MKLKSKQTTYIRKRSVDRAIFEGITAAAGIDNAKEFTGEECSTVERASAGISAIFEYVPSISEGDFLAMMAEAYRAFNR